MLQTIDNSPFGYSAHATYNRSITVAQLSIGGATDEKTGITGDRVDLSYFRVEESATYNSTGTVAEHSTAALDLLRSYIVELFRQQGLDVTLSSGDKEIDLQTMSPEDAQALIAEDGYFGVEQTSDRIVDFAIALAGNDPTRLDAILEGVERGFNEAREAFGGWLPDISYQTYDAVLQKLDAWANGNEPA